MNTNGYIDEVIKKYGLPSDRQAALKLGITAAAVSNYRKGRSHADDEVALKIADLLSLDERKVLADIAAERAKSPRARKVWLQVAGRAASLILGLGLMLDSASDLQARSLDREWTGLYIMRES